VSVDPVTGEVTYTPDPNFNGTDTFTYQICDTDGACDVAMIVVDVTPESDPPTANNDTQSTLEDTPTVIPVVSNDTDPDGNLDPTTVAITSPPSNGSVSVDPVTGEVTYTPDPNFSGTDTFTYQICDTTGLCDTATVTMSVSPVNDPPVANDDAATTPEDIPVVIDVAGNDTDIDGNLDPTTVTIVGSPSDGTVSVDPVTGEVTYTPDPNFNGTDTFTYQICDTAGSCDTAAVDLEITPVDEPPAANNDSATTPEGTPVTVDVTANDVGVDFPLDPTTVSIVAAPQNGSVTIDPGTGEVTYTPTDPAFNGTDTFTYQVCDVTGACDAAAVTVNVTPVNEPPVANAASYQTDEDIPISIVLEGEDPDGDTLLYSIASLPQHGTVSNLDPLTGSLAYTPEPGYNGLDRFAFQVCDPSGACDTAEVLIDVRPTNDPPTADSYDTTVPEGTPVKLQASGLDPDGDTVTFSIVDGPAHGTITEIDPQTGEFAYTSETGHTGPDYIVFEVCDPFGACAQGVIQLLVVRAAGAGGIGVECLYRVIISEIAWAGTAADPAHEWIELENLEPESIDLTGWTLRWRRKQPKTTEDRRWKAIPLAGLISAATTREAVPSVIKKEDLSKWLPLWEAVAFEDGFYLLERATDRVINDVRADLVYDDRLPLGRVLDLSDEGEVLELIDPLGCVVDTANADEPDRDGWAAGDVETVATMERTDSTVEDLDENWHTNLGVFTRGVDVSGKIILGTPRSENSPIIEGQ
ncbi:MAG TPA: Ig-like domain-containing protein, partial [Candidatus Heimdallarchaeota archaeon]|nr:Ig-like domain-containing protein [Candidatus Heimdallarchaeota archaeon]